MDGGSQGQSSKPQIDKLLKGNQGVLSKLQLDELTEGKSAAAQIDKIEKLYQELPQEVKISQRVTTRKRSRLDTDGTNTSVYATRSRVSIPPFSKTMCRGISLFQPKQ